MSGGWRGSTRKSRLPADWPWRRRTVMRRDKGVCWLCHRPGADRVDHKVPGDDHSLENLAPVHDAVPPHCHRTKSSQEGVQARAAIRAARWRPKPPHPGILN